MTDVAAYLLFTCSTGIATHDLSTGYKTVSVLRMKWFGRAVRS